MEFKILNIMKKSTIFNFLDVLSSKLTGCLFFCVKLLHIAADLNVQGCQAGRSLFVTQLKRMIYIYIYIQEPSNEEMAK